MKDGYCIEISICNKYFDDEPDENNKYFVDEGVRICKKAAKCTGETIGSLKTKTCVEKDACTDKDNYDATDDDKKYFVEGKICKTSAKCTGTLVGSLNDGSCIT